MNALSGMMSVSRASRNALGAPVEARVVSVSPSVAPAKTLLVAMHALNASTMPSRRLLKFFLTVLRPLTQALVFCACVQSIVQAQLVTTDCDSCVIMRTEEFAGAALAGHINGGAELYKEYGFKHLTVQYVRLPGEEELVVESYRMQSPPAAYGIYSIYRHECGDRDTSFTYFCSGPYQVQCAADSWYVRILNGTGSARAQAVSRTLLLSIARRTGQPRIHLPGLFLSPALSVMQDRVLLMSGALGVQNGMPDWGDLLDGLDKFALYAVLLDDERGTIAELHLADGEDAARVAQRIGVPTGQRSILQTAGALKGYAVWHSPLTLRILETTRPRSALGEFLDALAAEQENPDRKPEM